MVKYKKWDNQDGPSYSESKTNITMIKYQNGTKDVFSSENIGSNGGLSIQSAELKQILMSPINGNTAAEFLAGRATLSNDKNAGEAQISNFIVIFTNSPAQFEYQSNLISHVENSIWHSLKLDSVNANELKQDSLITVELIFDPKFRSSKVLGQTHWYVDLDTRILITKNRHRVKDDTFFRGTSVTNGKLEKWEAFQDAVSRSEKQLMKILTKYVAPR
jgi:DNA-binding transcriptional regulator YiaG